MKILGNHIQLNLIKNLIKKKQFPNSLILSGQKGIGKSLIAKNTAYCLVGCIKLDNLNYIKEFISHNILFICKDNLEEKKQSKQLMYRDDISHISSFFKNKNESHSKRVCIIDAIDDLSLDAINSLLKIIEEPNLNCHFILISHDNKKLLSTIKSRSFQIKFNNFKKSDFLSVLNEIDDLKTTDHSYLYELTRGSLDISKSYINNDFRDIDDHLQKIYEDKNNIKSNTAYHYISFLNNKGGDKALIISFFDYLILKKILFIKNSIKSLNYNKIDRFISMTNELKTLKERYITFNLSFEHILIHYFNRLKQ
ncbi:MAG: AAA family ATPase [Pelagibacterales bacterium]|nr:AAA family ATPase [Pelagibacterales bacterium]